MRTSWYLLKAGKLQKQPDFIRLPEVVAGDPGEIWLDIEDAEPEELRRFLEFLRLHPLMLDRCVDNKNVPGVVSYDQAILLEFPAALKLAAEDQVYLTFVLRSPVLVTIRHGFTPVLDELLQRLLADKAPILNHLVQIVYLILDELTDLSVEAETEIRDQILGVAKNLDDRPGTIQAGDITALRWRVDRLVSLIEDQLYCISALDASDNEVLNEPHRKAYLQDLQSEVEIAQRGIYRLETRVNDLFSYYQMVSSEKVERRLRTLTILAAVTLPLGLIAGILGMNVGGVPGTAVSYGFIIVIVLMFAITLAEVWYFKRKGWFD